MTEPYRFEHNGNSVEFTRNTVRAVLEADRIQDKLLGALGHVAGNPAPADVAGNVAEYAECMARAKTDAAWWCHSNMSETDMLRSYESYLEEDGSLVVAFRKANYAVAMPKKTDAPT